jgi:hypothetical protein
MISYIAKESTDILKPGQAVDQNDEMKKKRVKA